MLQCLVCHQRLREKLPEQHSSATTQPVEKQRCETKIRAHSQQHTPLAASLPRLPLGEAPPNANAAPRSAKRHGTEGRGHYRVGLHELGAQDLRAPQRLLAVLARRRLHNAEETRSRPSRRSRSPPPAAAASRPGSPPAPRCRRHRRRRHLGSAPSGCGRCRPRSFYWLGAGGAGIAAGGGGIGRASRPSARRRAGLSGEGAWLRRVGHACVLALSGGCSCSAMQCNGVTQRGAVLSSAELCSVVLCHATQCCAV